MTAPTVYSWDDAGAPAFLGATNLDMLNHQLNILKAGLVDGYGSKAAAGWSLIGHIPADGVTAKGGIALTNSRQTGAVKLTQSTPTYYGLQAICFDSMTDYENGLSGFSREKYITDHYTGHGSENYLRLVNYDGTKGWWHVVANEHCAILVQTWNASDGSRSRQAVSYFGEYDPQTTAMGAGDSGNFVCAIRQAGYASYAAWPNPSNLLVSNSRFYNGGIKLPAEATAYWGMMPTYGNTYYGDLAQNVPYQPFSLVEPASSPNVTRIQVIGKLYALVISPFIAHADTYNDNHANGRATGSILSFDGNQFMFVNEGNPTLIDLSAGAWP